MFHHESWTSCSLDQDQRAAQCWTLTSRGSHTSFVSGSWWKYVCSVCLSETKYSPDSTMSSRLGRGGGGGGGRKAFLSAHRCPEVDLLPHHISDEKSSESTCTGACEADYLDICFSGHVHRDKEDDDDESISDWSDEDLSLHFSPSVILQSDNEDSDPESGFECVDVTVETQVSTLFWLYCNEIVKNFVDRTELRNKIWWFILSSKQRLKLDDFSSMTRHTQCVQVFSLPH